ncbi:MAG: hypothetical protein UT02_C0003G0023 [Parcubacteria group bacterium GW2011_GWC2_38_7]|nr:MAG: hypothetical protein UT02_C0003G0023 [Parcubacteria group bacterium GW2011_GWC2_38_7]
MNLRTESDRTPILQAYDEPAKGLVGQVQVVPDGLVVSLVRRVVELHGTEESELAPEQVKPVRGPQLELPGLLASTRTSKELDPRNRHPDRAGVDFGPRTLGQEKELPCNLRGDLVEQATIEGQALLDIGRYGLDLEVAGERTGLRKHGRGQHQTQGEEQGSEAHRIPPFRFG